MVKSVGFGGGEILEEASLVEGAILITRRNKYLDHKPIHNSSLFTDKKKPILNSVYLFSVFSVLES